MEELRVGPDGERDAQVVPDLPIARRHRVHDLVDFEAVG
jgi:hypothetical protein